MGNSINAIVKQLDDDQSGAVHPNEVQAWIEDELFAKTPALQDKNIMNKLRAMLARLQQQYKEHPDHHEPEPFERQAVKKLMAKVDCLKQEPSEKDASSRPLVDAGNLLFKQHTYDPQYRQFSRTELTRFFEGLSKPDFEDLSESLLQHNSVRRRMVLRRVYDAMDLDKTGSVSVSEIKSWLAHEGAVVRVIPDLDERMHFIGCVVEDIDERKTKEFSFKEFEMYFSDWKIRHIRYLTRDLMKFDEKRRTRVSRPNGEGSDDDDEKSKSECDVGA